jgi:hypothetical protein
MTGPYDVDEPDDLISPAQLMRLAPAGPDPANADDHVLRPAPVPRITRMPKGVEVREQPLGRAVGHWVLQVRCDCGRRWFEVEQVATARCPRCGVLVLVDVEGR